MRYKSFITVLLVLIPFSAQAGSLTIGIGGIPADLNSMGLNLVVDSPLDLGDANPGDGICATTAATCTLRAAIEESNAYPSLDSITLPAETYVLSSSLTVFDGLSLLGEDRDTTIIDADGSDVALYLAPSLYDENATLDSVTIRGATQAGIYVEYGNVSVISSRVRDNSGDGVDCLPSFGDAALSLLDNEVLENGRSGVLVGAFCFARIAGSSISRNTQTGIAVDEEAIAILEYSYVGENLGGGIAGSGPARVELIATTVANNRGSGYSSVDGCAGLDAVNSTFSGNGVAISIPETYCGPYSLTSSTITGGIDFPEDADYEFYVRSTILAGSCGPGPLVSEGFNLIGDTTDCSIVGDTSTNITDVDPELGPLADNGGPTPTHRPRVGSPAIDVIPCSGGVDQRGVSRPQGPECDIGSVELGLFCEGFEPPMARGPVIVRGRRVLPFKAQLFSSEGQLVTDLDLTAAPRIQVWYEYGTPDAEDVSAQAKSTGQRTRGNQFFFDTNQRWHYNLATRVYSESGTYTVFMVSGEESEYFVEPSCRAEFIVK